LLRDFLVTAALLGVAAGVLAYFALRKHGPHNDRPLGGENVNVSHAARPQSEVSAAVDPRNPRIPVAGTARWHTRRVEPLPTTPYLLDDKPAIAVDTVPESPYRGRA
jgi:hypothetical protein